MSRTVIIGDVHGCNQELLSLLHQIDLQQSDRVVFVGDIVGRGPDTLGVLDLVLTIRGHLVRGNHEDKLLGYRAARARGVRDFHINRVLREAARHMTSQQWRLIESSPYWIDLPEHDVRVVHAGVIPDVPIDRILPHWLTNMRGVSETGEPSIARDSPQWGPKYTGPPHVVFGHNAMVEPQLHPWATGIDTGCVYGGRLTAMVLSPNERVPSPEERHRVLRFAEAAEAYCPVRRLDPDDKRHAPDVASRK